MQASGPGKCGEPEGAGKAAGGKAVGGKAARGKAAHGNCTCNAQRFVPASIGVARRCEVTPPLPSCIGRHPPPYVLNTNTRVHEDRPQ